VRRHLESCEECRKEAELLRVTLDVAVERVREKPKPSPPDTFASLFWQRERRERSEGERVRVRRLFASLRSVSVVKYAVAAMSAVAVIAVTLWIVHQGGEHPSEKGSGVPPSEREGELAAIEEQLEELEAAVRELRATTDTRISFTREEMREIYAAIGLAAANNYRDILNMNDVAAERYARVATAYPETSAGREARDILSRRLN